MFHRIFFFHLVCFFLLPNTSFSASFPTTQKKKEISLSLPEMRKVLADELHRTWTFFQKSKSKPKVYYLRFLLQQTPTVKISAQDGVLLSFQDDRKSPNHKVKVELRVGNYQFDQTGQNDYDYDLYRTLIYPHNQLPLLVDEKSLKTALWKQTDYEWKVARAQFQKKKYQQSLKVDLKDKSDDFSKEKKILWEEKIPKLTMDTKKWKAILKRVTSRFRKNPRIIHSAVQISANQDNQIILSSDGSQITKNKTIYMVHMQFYYLSPQKELLSNSRMEYVDQESKLPNEKKLVDMAEKTLKELKLQGDAMEGEHIEAPAILLPDVSGVLFHEALGHRLESHRMLQDDDGKTFLKKIGEQVTPSFLTVWDDPTFPSWKGTPLNGHYWVDDQGVKSQKTLLIEKGVLKGFLMSRKPVPPFQVSNGHGRAMFGKKPVSRMGNVMVESSHTFPLQQLKKMLLEEGRRQKKPYVYIISRASGGYTHTGTYNIQSFKNRPKLVYQINVKTGAQVLVQGLEMIGTPLTVVKNIVATGDNYGVFNGFCGAESGYVPVSVVAPSLLLKTVELQRVKIPKKKNYKIPPPFSAP